MLNFINKTKNVHFDVKFQQKLITLYSCILQELSMDEIENVVSLIIVDDIEMQAICKMYYPNKKTTDVLAFTNDKDLKNQLGDIVISIDVVKNQFKKYYDNMEDEIYFLFIHGCLHLLGFNHLNNEEDAIMKSFEQKIFNKFKKQ